MPLLLCCLSVVFAALSGFCLAAVDRALHYDSVFSAVVFFLAAAFTTGLSILAAIKAA